ncbi:hypothetical protein M409DRAFT_23959 [Zasmidium cellare ATCC 36951]|uniref:Uncharacterized protein n=1 Tax=Zasmidium cellare ATCC 36951 TaxID=1080233 RepID=A0A6A6CJ02_ZASCE|nr:uncharacterized protein M409DRAFT_23959 [Zasmidium cellare ATCC 36951]KAF2165669.1 hypothetical protein M409DRAFT_23959 [Zasmidium cellare ATCC 36951]
MLLSHILPSLALYAIAKAAPSPLQARQERVEHIKWTSCGSIQGLDIQCGTLAVPLDYTDPASNRTLKLVLRKIPAANAPSKGSILLNYVGPGLSGLEGLSIFGPQQLNITGGNHDLIAFDPRGTGNDSLRFTCYDTEQERVLAQLNDRPLFNSSDVAPGEAWGLGRLLANDCGKAQNQTGELVGTAFTARDMMAIVDALDEDGLLRYWGLSYGTILGATVAKLFPGRMDAIILDGVVNVREYYQGSETIEGFTDAEATFDIFLDACIANPVQCPLARNRTSSQLKNAIFARLEHIKAHPLPLLQQKLLLNYATVKSLIYNNLWFPSLWPSFSMTLDALLTNNVTAFEKAFESQLGLLGVGFGTESRYGVECSDILTRNPVLFIGNSVDPTTPLVSAWNVSAGFRGSVVLRQDGVGHTSLAQASVCTSNAIAAYFNHGSLPAPGTVCPVDVGTWSS